MSIADNSSCGVESCFCAPTFVGGAGADFGGRGSLPDRL